MVKGDSLGEPFWEALRGLPRITWLYDEVRRTRWTVDRARRHRADRHLLRARLHRLRVRGPGLAPPAAGLRSPAGASTDHAPRLPRSASSAPATRRASGVLTHLHDPGCPSPRVRTRLVEPPGRPVRTWRVGHARSSRPIATSHVPTAYDVMAASAATLNLHGDQDGFTMRTFEAAGVGGVQLVDRTDVDGLYLPGTEVLTWTSRTSWPSCAGAPTPTTHGTTPSASAGRARTLAEHTFDHRVAVLEGAWDTA